MIFAERIAEIENILELDKEEEEYVNLVDEVCGEIAGIIKDYKVSLRRFRQCSNFDSVRYNKEDAKYDLRLIIKKMKLYQETSQLASGNCFTVPQQSPAIQITNNANPSNVVTTTVNQKIDFENIIQQIESSGLEEQQLEEIKQALLAVKDAKKLSPAALCELAYQLLEKVVKVPLVADIIGKYIKSLLQQL